VFGTKSRAETSMTAEEYRSARKVVFTLKRRMFVIEFGLIAAAMCVLSAGGSIVVAATYHRTLVSWHRLGPIVVICTLVPAVIVPVWNFLFSSLIPRKLSDQP
jgi:hypothetical protein